MFIGGACELRGMDDIRFGTGGWRAAGEAFSEDRIKRIGQGVATYLLDTAGGSSCSLVIGYDARETSRGAAETLADVVTANGIDVYLPERDLPTPVIAYTIADRELSGGLVVTASHNPPEYNGVKYITGDAMAPLPEVTDAIERRIAEPRWLPEDQHGDITSIDPVPAHADQAEEVVREYFETDLSDMTVVYDAIHGSARGITDALLENAGANVVRTRCTRDPEFGGVAPEPTPATLERLPDLMARHDADLGIANDGDGDRIAVATPSRGVLTGHKLFAGLYDAILTDGGEVGAAVRTVSTTFLIDRIAEAHGSSVIEVPVGFKFVAAAMGEHDALFGGEESGGFTIKGHIGEKDGVLMALLVCAASRGESLDSRLDRLAEVHGEIYANKISVDCPDAQKSMVLEQLGDRIPAELAGRAVFDTVSVDGFKLLFEDGSWILIRPSGTEPKLRVYAESPDQEALPGLLTAGRELLEPLIQGELSAQEDSE